MEVGWSYDTTLYCKPRYDSLLRELTSIIHRAEP